MKPITKLLLIVAFAFSICMTTKAQDPQFTITWEGCELSTDKSYYEVSYNIYYVPGPGQVYPTTQIVNVGHNLSLTVPITTWDCDQSIEKKYYVIYAAVVLRSEDGTPYCSGVELFGPMTCSELYEGNSYNVVME